MTPHMDEIIMAADHSRRSNGDHIGEVVSLGHGQVIDELFVECR